MKRYNARDWRGHAWFVGIVLVAPLLLLFVIGQHAAGRYWLRLMDRTAVASLTVRDGSVVIVRGSKVERVEISTLARCAYTCVDYVVDYECGAILRVWSRSGEVRTFSLASAGGDRESLVLPLQAAGLLGAEVRFVRAPRRFSLGETFLVLATVAWCIAALLVCSLVR